MNTETTYWLFILLLFIVAFLYASVGHGGASGYLALMALFGIAPSVMKSSALLMNIFVSLIAFYEYYRGGHFRWKLFFPFAIASIPFSFMGAYITLDAFLYKKILGVILIFPILRLFGIFGKGNESEKEINRTWAFALGALIGLLSGIIGIGGGIILSPIILLLHWGNMKETAAVSALFIFVNSVSGLAGVFSNGVSIDHSVYVWVFVALLGGFSGAYFGSRKLNNPVLKKILSVVLVIASVKLLTVSEK
ncbi:MAG: sulfite exporter TauE/SafE family protein [Bacteroidetes bacterium]|nr:sulfite exporter TauE/SafE family protein [Bacteroidota bacterium]